MTPSARRLTIEFAPTARLDETSERLGDFGLNWRATAWRLS